MCVCKKSCGSKERKKYFKMSRFTKRFVFFKDLFIHFVLTYEYGSSLLFSFRQHIWHKSLLMGYSITCVSILPMRGKKKKATVNTPKEKERGDFYINPQPTENHSTFKHE